MITLRATCFQTLLLFLVIAFTGCASTESQTSKATDVAIKQLIPMDIKETEITRKPFATTQAKSWNLQLINMTSSCMELASIRPANGEYGKWFNIPKTCQTCQGNYEQCFQAKKWQTILVTACTDRPFDIRISTQPDQNGQGIGNEFKDLRPTCDYAGGAIGLE